jgi:queuosine precursor transporter
MSAYFTIIVAVFITCLITANITAVKLIAVGGLVFPAGLAIFPISYVCGDVLTEVYGYAQVRRVIWRGFLCNLLAGAAIRVGQVLPPAAFWDAQPAYVRILGSTPRLLGASVLAYLVGQFANAAVLAKMKVATQGRWRWTRGLDSLVFITVAFAGALPAGALAVIILTQWLVKVTYEALMTPVTYRVVACLKQREGREAYDDQLD